MKFTTITALLVTLGLATAAPTTPASPLERRACSVAKPRDHPTRINVSQDANKQNVIAPVVIFDSVPAGSYGCQLEVNFPAGYPITSSGASQVNVWKADADGRKQFIFGTVTFASSPVAPTKFVINSAVCERNMLYRLEIASDNLPGSVWFDQKDGAGFTMTYNC